LTWTEKGINNLIEVCPTFEKESVIGWNLYAAAYYDQPRKRYYLKRHFAENTTLDEIAMNAEALILGCYKFLRNIKREEIPFAVEMD
jgi:hypothetical protein